MAIARGRARQGRVSAGRQPPPEPGTIDLTQSLALRLAGLAALLTFGLALYARSLELSRTDVPFLSSNGRLFWILCIVAAILVGVVVRRVSAAVSPPSNPASRHVDRYAASAGILPALAVFAVLQLVAWDSRFAVVLAAPLLAGAGSFTAIVVRYYLVGSDPAVFRGARLVHSVLTVGVAFLSLSLVRGWMGGPIYTLIVVLALAGVLLYQAFDGIRAFRVRRAAYALAGGVTIAEAALAMVYWPPSGWYGGAILTVLFVAAMLTIEAILARRVSTDLVARYVGAGVGVCGLLALLAR